MAGTAAVKELFAHGLHVWLRFFKHALIASDHKCQRSTDCAGSGAGAWDIEELDALRFELLADGAAGSGRDGARISGDGSRLGPGNHSVGTGEHLLGHARIADAGKNDFR